MPHKTDIKNEIQFFLSATLAPKESYGHRPLISVVPHCPDSYRECAAITDLAIAESFIAAGAAVTPSTKNIKLFYNNFHVNILCLLS